MRKLTGYIGALIIVFALMGSILAGYALNVNGSSSVINEYERVTDVSGLYTHSQEPSYIDYNPASNYIGYQIEQTDIYSDIGPIKAKKIESYTNFTIEPATGNFNINSTYYGTVNSQKPLFMCGKLYAEWNTNQVIIRGDFNTNYNDGWVSFRADGSTIEIYKNDVLQKTINDTGLKVCYTGMSNYFDYYITNGRDTTGGHQNNNDYYAYVNNISDIVTYSLVSPRIGDTGGVAPIVTCGNKWLGENRVNGTIVSGSMTAPAMFTDITEIGNGVYRVNANFANYTTSELGQPILNRTISGYYIAYPASVKTNGLGITYTESNRVNNYLINTDPGSIIINTATIDLMGISAGDLFPNQDIRFRTALIMDDFNMEYQGGRMWARWFGPYLTPNSINYDEHGDAIHRYSLADILSTYNIPAGVNQLTITANSNDIRNYTPLGMNFKFDMNMCAFNINNPDGTYLDKMYSIAGQKDYIIYDLNDGLCRLYSYDGVLKGSGTPSQIRVTFIDNTYSFGYYQLTYGDYPPQSTSSLVDMGNRARPFITIQSTISNPANNHYMDITKGISIKNDNAVNTIWNNEYTNGNIQLLFRAEDTNATYHNDIIVGDNTISVNYTSSGYSITINGGDPVAVGKWRNIVLNIELRTGELSAIPVRTFNSYTNVVLDTASIVIGDLVNPTPTNIIKWAPTPNSLMFNVYSTAVFMNTYGVVMVNPQLDITEYFTDLNGFYRMRLYNFSVLGSSITVNGVTADVTNNTITINDQTVQIKDMAITYADGHAYISDSNVNIDLGEVVNNNISMSGAWYFETELLKGYTSQKMIYTWDWGDFILNNTQFCIMYIGIALIGLIVARRYCSLSITDYIVLIASFAIALTVQVVA